MVSKVIKDDSDIYVLLVSSLIGDGIANEFIQYTKLYHKLPTLEDILNNPKDIAIPEDLATTWATMSMVTHSITVDNHEKLTVFLRRLSAELQYCALREIKYRNPAVLSKVIDWVKDLAHEVM